MMRFCEERVLHFFCFLSAFFSFLKKKNHPLVLLRLSSAYVLL